MSTATNTVEEVAPTSTLPSILSHSKFLGHLYSYPTVNAAVDFAVNLPSVQKISTKASPIVHSLKEKSKPFSEPVIKRATPVLSKADQIGDKILSRVDESFPRLKETKTEDVVDFARKPYETVVSTAGAYSTAAQDRISTNLVQPIKKAGERAKEHYNTVYDNTGKPLIKSQIYPYITPINHRIEVIIKHYLPEGSDIPESSANENEIARTIQLAHVALQRAKPIIDQQASQLATLPASTREHVQKVYDEKLTGYGKNGVIAGPVLASIATWKQLSTEGVSLASNIFSTQIVYLKNTLGNLKNESDKADKKENNATNSAAAAADTTDSNNFIPSTITAPVTTTSISDESSVTESFGSAD